MKPASIFSRKTFGLDYRVWWVMIASILLSTALLGYRSSREEKCAQFSIEVGSLASNNDNLYYAGETLSFTTSSLAKNIEWNFDDGHNDLGPAVIHRFLKEGLYVIRASTNSTCYAEYEILISKPEAEVVDSSMYVGQIHGPNLFNAFTEQKFAYIGAGNSFKWKVLNHPDMGTGTEQTIAYTFVGSGTYFIQVEVLVADRWQKSAIFEVKVLAQPKQIERQITPHPTPSPFPLPPKNPVPDDDTIAVTKVLNKYKFVGHDLFLKYLKNVKEKSMGIKDFEQYGVVKSTPVIANGDENNPKDFGWLCNELTLTKKKGIPLLKKTLTAHLESVKLDRFDENGPVQLIHVKYEFK